MNKPLVSVIVPMYNVERYLSKCLDSILAQTLQGIEIVCVDDGSPDASGEIAEAYAAEHENIKVVHQENGGLGPARNTGIAHAEGEYVGFVDSDDWVSPDMYRHLYTVALSVDADIVVGGHCDASEEGVLCVKRHPLAGVVARGREEIDPIRARLYGHDIHDTSVESFPMAVWTSIYRRSMLLKQNLQFKDILSEDTIFNLQAYACADVMAFIDAVGYLYRKEGQDSITKTLRPDLVEKFVSFVSELDSISNSDLATVEAKQRVGRTAIDCARQCSGIIADSCLRWSQKISWMNNLGNSDLVTVYSSFYPLQSLPFAQRLFHNALLGRRYSVALSMVSLREKVKKTYRRLRMKRFDR